MKKWLLFGLAFVIYQEWGSIHYYLNPPPDYAQAHQGKVILYGTSWCGFCAKARSLLSEQGVDYVEYDIEKSTEGHTQYKRLGGRGVPVLLIDGKVIRGYRPDSIIRAIQQTGQT